MTALVLFLTPWLVAQAGTAMNLAPTLTCVRMYDAERRVVTATADQVRFNGTMARIRLDDGALACASLSPMESCTVTHAGMRQTATPGPIFLRPGDILQLPTIAAADGTVVRVIERELVPRNDAYILCLGLTDIRTDVLDVAHAETQASVFRGLVRYGDERTGRVCLTLNRQSAYQVTSLRRPGIWHIPANSYPGNSVSDWRW